MKSKKAQAAAPPAAAARGVAKKKAKVARGAAAPAAAPKAKTPTPKAKKPAPKAKTPAPKAKGARGGGASCGRADTVGAGRDGTAGRRDLRRRPTRRALRRCAALRFTTPSL